MGLHNLRYLIGAAVTCCCAPEKRLRFPPEQQLTASSIVTNIVKPFKSADFRACFIMRLLLWTGSTSNPSSRAVQEKGEH